jgi:hypothetical protein
MMRILSLLLMLAWLAPLDADARRRPLDPQNRVHVGVSMVDNTALGVTGGLDTRLTRLLFVDVGGWLITSELPEPTGSPSSDPGAWIHTRHCLFVTPGIRIPHQQGPSWSWDLTARVGAGTLWSVDQSDSDWANKQSSVTVIGGGDFIVRFEQIGLRASGKALWFQPFSQIISEELTIVRPQAALEAVWQW